MGLKNRAILDYYYRRALNGKNFILNAIFWELLLIGIPL